jgi:hypothetical protein
MLVVVMLAWPNMPAMVNPLTFPEDEGRPEFFVY